MESLKMNINKPIIKTFKRKECKFLINKEQLDNLLKVLEENLVYDKYSEGGKYYLIRNIYYDTSDNNCIRKSLFKPQYKEKMRLRKYGYYNDNGKKYYLEIKKKCYGIVSKRRIGLSLDEVNNLVHNHIKPVRETYLDKQIINEFIYYLSINNIKEKVFISYERLAFFDPDNPNFRLTIDKNIIANRNNFDFDNTNYEEKIIDDDNFLMEIKIPYTIPMWLAKALNENKIYSSSFSKYGKEFELFTQDRIEERTSDI